MSLHVQEIEAEMLQASLELESYLEGLEHGLRPHRPRQVSPDQMKIYQMVALFRAASPGATEPDPRFVDRLQAQVEEALGNRTCRDKE